MVLLTVAIGLRLSTPNQHPVTIHHQGLHANVVNMSVQVTLSSSTSLLIFHGYIDSILADFHEVHSDL